MHPAISLPEGNWRGLRYPGRIPPLPRDQQSWLQRIVLAVIRRASGDSYDYNCFLVLARLGRIFFAHTVFLSQLLKGGAISAADTERIIIRVAWRKGIQYEYGHHTRMAMQLGITWAEIVSLTNETDESWTERTRTLMTAADELLSTDNLSPVAFARLRGELGENQIAEFCMLVGHYVMAGMVLGVAGVEIEPGYALVEADRA